MRSAIALAKIKGNENNFWQLIYDLLSKSLLGLRLCSGIERRTDLSDLRKRRPDLGSKKEPANRIGIHRSPNDRAIFDRPIGFFRSFNPRVVFKIRDHRRDRPWRHGRHLQSPRFKA